MIPDSLKLEEAIIARMKEPRRLRGPLTQPYLVWTDLRETLDVDEATVRATMEDMHRRRILARAGYLYCLSEQAEALRAGGFRGLEGVEAIRKYRKIPRGDEMFDRAWRGAESWTGLDFE